jgi:acyl-CoA reductase-like NAD-dependent aldehyde dehydrogenase
MNELENQLRTRVAPGTPMGNFLRQYRIPVPQSADLPFGGCKASGVGPAEDGRANREFFTQMQAIYFAQT